MEAPIERAANDVEDVSRIEYTFSRGLLPLLYCHSSNKYMLHAPTVFTVVQTYPDHSIIAMHINTGIIFYNIPPISTGASHPSPHPAQPL